MGHCSDILCVCARVCVRVCARVSVLQLNCLTGAEAEKEPYQQSDMGAAQNGDIAGGQGLRSDC